MAGLLAARVLSEHFDVVTIIERDVLPSAAAIRKGVPQAAHAHGLLASGYRTLDQFFPGMMDDLEASGAPRADIVGNFLWFQYGRWKLRHDSGLRGITVSRPCLEAAIRQRVRSRPKVRFVEGTDVVAPVFDTSANRVTGVEVRSRADGEISTLQADLVVDASGRGSQSPKWLDQWGYGRPATESVKVDVGYATRVFERRPGEFFDTVGGVIAGTPPLGTRLSAVLAAEGDRWVITLAGCGGDYPPDDEAGWLAFAASLPVPVVHELAAKARPLSEIVTYRFSANQRRRYERMNKFPGGYLVMGDGMCSFNPIYGQGMSVAALESSALDETLRAGHEDLARRYFAKASAIIDIPWTIATGEDLRYPDIEGPRPMAFEWLNRYMDKVHALASEDEQVCRQFFEVLNLLAPPASLMTPRVAWKVMTRRSPSGQGSPWGTVHAAVSTQAASSLPR
jgi:2-polyprenyl-6-methoxyphenol hydroxylase-like FAD-dependent oxidoreductase